METTVNKIAPDLYEIRTSTRTTNVTAQELTALQTFSRHERLRNEITYVVDHMIEDGDLDMSDYPYSYEELIDEIYIDYEDRLDNDEIPFPADDDVFDSVIDLIDFYNHNK